MNEILRVVDLKRLLLILDTTPKILLERIKYSFSYKHKTIYLKSSNIKYIVNINKNQTFEYVEHIIIKKLIYLTQLNYKLYCKTPYEHTSLLEIINNMLKNIGFNISQDDIVNKICLHSDVISDKLDHNIFNTIELLNNNDYVTYFSCSGHCQGVKKINTLYITFKHNHKLILLIHHLVEYFTNETNYVLVNTRLTYHFKHNTPTLSLYLKIKDGYVNIKKQIELNNTLYIIIYNFIHKDEHIIISNSLKDK